MASLRQIRRRVKSAKNIMQITKAMKMVAAARLRRSQARILAARPFAEKVGEVLADLAGRNDMGLHPLMAKRPEGGTLHLVVFAADKGMCGGFNGNVLRRTLQILRENPNRNVSLTLIGRKACDFFKRFDFPIEARHQLFLNKLAYTDAEVIAGKLIEGFASGKHDEVVLVYTQFKSVVSLKVTEQRLLPLAPAQPAEGGAAREYTFEPGEKQVLGVLVPRAVKTMVWRALLESQASEFAARMTAMDSASRNSGEMIGNLTLAANRIRQAAITKEISELVGGAEALK